MPDIMPRHGLKQLHSIRHVIPVIHQWIRYGFSYQRKSRKMHDRRDFVLAENTVQQLWITDISLDQGSSRQQVPMPA